MRWIDTLVEVLAAQVDEGAAWLGITADAYLDKLVDYAPAVCFCLGDE